MDLNALKDEVWAGLKTLTGKYFDKEEDLESLKAVAEEMARQKFAMLTGTDAEREDGAANLKTWENVARLMAVQKVIKVSSGAEELLSTVLGIAGKFLAFR